MNVRDVFTKAAPFTTLLCLASAVQAGGPVRYVSAEASGGGDGSINEPWTLDEAQNQLTSGMTLRLRADVYRQSATNWPNGLSDVVVEGAPEDLPDRPVLRGDRVVPVEQWTNHGDGSFSAVISEEAHTVVWNWDDNLTEETPPRKPRHFGHLVPQSSQSEVAANPGSWWWSEQSGRLWISPPPGAAAPDQGDTYAYGVGGNAFVFKDVTNFTWRNIDTKLWVGVEPSPSSQIGYAIRLTGAQDATIEDSLAIDAGFHAYGVLDVEDDCVIQRCEVRGQNGNNSQSKNPFVMVPGVDGGGDVAFKDLEYHAYDLLDFNGDPIGKRPFVVVNSHDSQGVGFLQSVEVDQPRAIQYDRPEDKPAQMLVVNVSSVAEPVPNIGSEGERNPDNWPAVVTEPFVKALHQVRFDGVFVDRAVIDLTEMALVDGNVNQGLVTANRTAFRSSLFMVEAGTQSNNSFLLHGGQKSFFLCAFWFGPNNPATGGTSLMRELAGESNSEIVCDRSVIIADGSSGAKTRVINAQSDSDGSSWTFTDNWYFGFDAEDGYASGNLGFDSQSEWQAEIDPAGVYDVDPELANPPDDLSPAPGGALRTSVDFDADFADAIGVAGNPYSGHYGAYQFGGVADFDGDGVVDGSDLGTLLGAWGPCPGPGQACLADLSGDGQVDGADLGMLLGQWTVD